MPPTRTGPLVNSASPARPRASGEGEAIAELIEKNGLEKGGWQEQLLTAADSAHNQDGRATAREVDAYLQAPDDGEFLTSDVLHRMKEATGEKKSVRAYDSAWERKVARLATGTSSPSSLTAAELERFTHRLLEDGFQATASAKNEPKWLPDQKAAALLGLVAQETGEKFALNAAGEKQTDGTTLMKDYMRIRANDAWKVPEYVSYQLSAADLNLLENAEAPGAVPPLRRSDNFRQDPAYPFSSKPADYAKSGMAQGHLKPAEDSPNAESMHESFVLTNISPQKPGLNSEAWMILELATRQLVKATGASATVFTGNLFLNSKGERTTPTKFIGNSKVAVPTHLWKAVLVNLPNGKKTAFAYLVPNKDPSTEHRREMAKFLKGCQVSVDTLEKITGLNLFANLDLGPSRTIEGKQTPDIVVPDAPRTKAAKLLWPTPAQQAEAQITEKQVAALASGATPPGSARTALHSAATDDPSWVRQRLMELLDR